MPHDARFIERFSEHSRLIVPAAEAFRALMSGDGRAEQHALEISRLEDAADQITRDTVLAIHRTFVTPFDRSQILDLITALDDTPGSRPCAGGWHAASSWLGVSPCPLRRPWRPCATGSPHGPRVDRLACYIAATGLYQSQAPGRLTASVGSIRTPQYCPV